MTIYNDLSYITTPFLAWFFTGVLKFLVNFFKNGINAFKLIGYGGFPSNHASIAFSSIGLIFSRFYLSPELLVCITFSLLVILDASSLRMQISRHAKVLNVLNTNGEPLRERIGHTKFELLGGAILGFSLGYADLSVLIINFLAHV